MSLMCFNTSHVILYLNTPFGAPCTDKCFNTSHVILYQHFRSVKYPLRTCFNTSHVILYRFLSSPRLVYCPGFNTSHVILYLPCCARKTIHKIVSIHLMLFFIPRFSNLFHANFLYNSAKYKDLQHFSQVM